MVRSQTSSRWSSTTAPVRRHHVANESLTGASLALAATIVALMTTVFLHVSTSRKRQLEAPPAAQGSVFGALKRVAPAAVALRYRTTMWVVVAFAAFAFVASCVAGFYARSEYIGFHVALATLFGVVLVLMTTASTLAQRDATAAAPVPPHVESFVSASLGTAIATFALIFVRILGGFMTAQKKTKGATVYAVQF